MIDRKALLADLQKQVKVLELDLREQVETEHEVGSRLRSEYDTAFKLGRTADTWRAWSDERITQAAVAWVLGTVFVRFCEDNGLLTELFLAGPTKESLILAEESEAQYFRTDADPTLRGWLLASFGALAESQAGRSLFDQRHNPLYGIPVSHDGAKALVAFWRQRAEDGELIHRFEDPEWDTRFLGDLYQDLSEAARKRYALLQTPEFVEEFILDLTLTPALHEFGHEGLKMIDPTCGSGHFVLGAFHRILAVWDQEAPGRDKHQRVRLALDSVHGVDLNPFAVAVARFRLLIAALQASGVSTLDEARGLEFPLNLAVGDSLIKARQLDLFGGTDELAEFHYATEDVHEYPGILERGRYHVVVGNPPYITVADRKLNDLYRDIWDACSGTYSLAVPFAQRFFDLGKRVGASGGPGYVGQITANSFMKREFGQPLITQFFTKHVDFTYVVDTSGAFIPGHGTPTVILVGRPRNGGHATTVRTVRSVRGEPGIPEDAAEGQVWSAIVSQIDSPGSASEWVSVGDLDRSRYFNRIPWILKDGGLELVEEIENASSERLKVIATAIGRTTHTGSDDAFYVPRRVCARKGLGAEAALPVVLGENVRDFSVETPTWTLFPYDMHGAPREIGLPEHKFYLPNRTVLRRRVDFGQTPAERGLRWFDHSMFFPGRFSQPTSIAFAFVSTHNHFVLDHGGKVFKQSAPVIKLLADASVGNHLQVMGVLNSSTACFWLKQVSHDKGSQSGTGGFMHDEWERFYEFTGTKLEQFPLPSAYPLERAQKLDNLAQVLTTLTPAAITASGVPTRESLMTAHIEYDVTRAQLIATQEELDWEVYRLYGLLGDDLTITNPPELRLGERAFEIVLARQVVAGEEDTVWFARHGSTPITEIPAHWPDDYQALVQRRIELIESDRNIGLIERPECKRRWQSDGWDVMQKRALEEWLADRCEQRELWFAKDEHGVEQPQPITINQLADKLRAHDEVQTVAELYAPRQDLAKTLEKLLDSEHVPFLAALRYKPSGLAKRADWEHVWELQRTEDATADEPAKRAIRDTIPVPPKYTSADFTKTSYWQQRGKLDVPKERFISYAPGGRDNDPTLLLGWAGWDHREQAHALATLISEREQSDGWGKDRLVPLLAGLREVMPWVRQWHNDFDPVWGASPAEIYDGFLTETSQRLHLTNEELDGWRPATRTRARRNG